MAKPKTKPPRRDNGKHPGGRPKINLDYSWIKKLSHIQCTQQEIADFLGVSVDTLQRDEEFCGIYKKAHGGGKMSLRRLQWAGARKGNSTMLVWLGKQYLGQADKQEHTGKDGSPIHIHLSNDDTKLL